MKWNVTLTGLSLALLTAVCGCTHDFEWTNQKELRTYAYDTACPGLIVTVENPKMNAFTDSLCLSITEALASRGNYQAHYRTMPGPRPDVNLKLTFHERTEGHWTNFLVSFPGYILFTPAWLGYRYTYTLDATCELRSAKTGKSIEVLTIPVSINIRHTDAGRGWANNVIWPIAPFSIVNGFYATSYDDDVTPLIPPDAYQAIADVIAEKLVIRINAHPDFMPTQAQP